MKRRRQVAAIPIREGRGGPEVCLVTSRGTGRWIVPKGNVPHGVAFPDMAAIEAYEEAGVTGHIDKRPIGSFTYGKRSPTGEARGPLIRVDAYILMVLEELDEWPEKDQRQREWVPVAEAALRVQEPGLVTLLLKLAAPHS